MFPADHNPNNKDAAPANGVPNGSAMNGSSPNGDGRLAQPLDQQTDALLTRALQSEGPTTAFVESLADRLQGEFAMIHGAMAEALETTAPSDADNPVTRAADEQAPEHTPHQTHRSGARRWWSAVAASLLIAAAFWSARPSYSWAGMVQAMNRQSWMQSDFMQSGVVRVRRWVSSGWATGQGGVAASSSDGNVRYVDRKSGVVLTHSAGAKQITQSPLPAATAPRQGDSLKLLLSELLEPTAAGAEGDNGNSVGDWQYVEDSWHRGANYGDRDDLVALLVKFRNADGSIAEVEFLLDPETHLPVAARRVSGPKAGARNTQANAGKPESPIVEFNFDNNGPESIYDLGADRAKPIVASDQAIADADSPAMVSMRSATSGMAVLTPKAGAMAAADAMGDAALPPAQPEFFDKTIDAEDEAVESVEVAAGNTPPVEAPAWTPLADTELPPPMEDGQLTARVDNLLQAHWQQVGVQPVARASDAELLRRLQLDLTGRIPTAGEVRVFLEDTSPGYRERLVDTLLESRDHATHFAAMWRRALIPRGVDLTPYGGPVKLEEWLSNYVQRNTPHNELASDLLLAEGRISESGPLLFYASLKLNPEELAARTARTFLGMRMECAQCHDHPFDERITQDDFWAFAANFARISRPRGMIEVASPVLRVHDIDRGEVMLPDTETVVAPSLPLTDRQVLDVEGWPSRREQMADWLTSPGNHRFARATVNRIWAQLFGRALVEPIDDIRDDSVPLVPEVLDALAEDYARSGFDTRRLIRCLVMTDAYQLTSADSTETADVAGAPPKTEVFARMNLKPFTAEQLHDAIAVAARSTAAAQGMANGGLVRFGDTNRDAFIRLFEAPNDQAIDYQAGIPQALTLMHGQLIHGATDVSSSGMLRSLSAPFFSDSQRVETLFLATLSRMPTDAERATMEGHVSQAEDRAGRQQKLGDVLWALLNSAEFTLNH